MIDSHVHTHYSHGSAEVFEMAEAASRLGLTDLGLAEHFHYDYFNDLGLPTVSGRSVEGTPLDRFKLYYRAAQRAKEYYRGKLNIRIGAEVDYLPSKEEEIKQVMDATPFKNDYKVNDPSEKFNFDFIMGAVHFIGQPLKYFSDYASKGDDWMINEYFTLVKSCVASGIFDIIAHPELIKYFIAKSEDDYLDHLEELTDLLGEKNMAVDVNTDFMKNSKTEKIIKERINPGIVMLKLCQKKNIPLILGSDAHKPQKIANNFSVALELLNDLGINNLFYLEGRKLKEYSIL